MARGCHPKGVSVFVLADGGDRVGDGLAKWVLMKRRQEHM